LAGGCGRRSERTALIVERERETTGESLTGTEQFHGMALACQTFPAALQVGANGEFLPMREVGELLALRPDLGLG
jgi:hypothetical protein